MESNAAYANANLTFRRFTQQKGIGLCMMTWLAVICLCGCGGETNSGVNCRFGFSEVVEETCAGDKCTCRLIVSIQNLGTLPVSGVLHYDAFDAEERNVAFTDIQVTNLAPGDSTRLENDLREVDSNKLLRDCSNVARVEATRMPNCP